MRFVSLGLGLLLLAAALTGCATTNMTVSEAHAKAISETRWESEPDDAPFWSSDPAKQTIFSEISSKLRGR